VKGERGEQGEVGPVGARGGPVSTPTAGDNLQHARSKSPCMISLEVIMEFEKIWRAMEHKRGTKETKMNNMTIKSFNTKAK
jgi:hypothetical protein